MSNPNIHPETDSATVERLRLQWARENGFVRMRDSTGRVYFLAAEEAAKATSERRT